IKQDAPTGNLGVMIATRVVLPKRAFPLERRNGQRAREDDGAMHRRDGGGQPRRRQACCVRARRRSAWRGGWARSHARVASPSNVSISSFFHGRVAIYATAGSISISRYRRICRSTAIVRVEAHPEIANSLSLLLCIRRPRKEA